MTATQQRILYAILAAYVVVAVIYSIATPLFEASDELWHYPMVQYLATHGLQLPPQDPANPGLWRQEGSQPPLYYILSAVLTAGIDTSNMETVRRVNPHADIGVIRPDGNANMIVHRQDAETFPWHGTALAVHIIRFFSIALGLGTVIVTYQLAREIFPQQPVIALGAAALNAFLPMFLFISASVNNDNLSNLLGNLLTLLIVRLLKMPSVTLPYKKLYSGWHTYTFIGVVTGAGLLAKLNIGFLIPLVALALMVVSLRQRDWHPLIIGGTISAILTAAIAGWWYLRNQQLYGDPTGLSMFLQMVGRRAIPANAAQLWSERNSFTQAYWGFFGGVNVALPDVIYLIFNIIGGLALLSAMAFIVYTLARRRWSLAQWLAAAITLVWPILIFISYLRWTAETEASQGRLIFVALSALSMWMAVGVGWWLPKRIQAWLMTGVAGFFAVVTVLTPFLILAPAYTLPAEIGAGNPTAVFSEPNGTGQLGLNGSQILTAEVQPEDYAQIELDWQVIQPMSRDWSLFVHLVTPDGVIIGQRDIYPGEGKLATSDLPAGRAWANPVAISIPSAAYAPMMLDIEVGWYDLKTGERLKLGSDDMFDIGQVQLQPRADNLGVPNPIHVNFDNQIELIGYSLSDLSPQAGDTIDLTLYWRGLRKIEDNYVVFAHILKPPQTIYAGSDAMPVQWNAPTSTWEPGKIVEDMHTLTLKSDTPPETYELEIGLYLQQPDGSFPRLRVVTPDGGMADNYVYLSRIRVLPPGDSP